MSTLARRYAWMAAAIALGFALWILRSFLVPMTWAFMIALATWPLYRRFVAGIPTAVGLNGAAFLFTGLVTLFLLGPFIFALVTIAEQVQVWAHQVAVAEKQGLAAPEWLSAVPLAGAWLVDRWNEVLGTPGGITRWLNRPESGWLRSWVGSAGQFALRHATVIVFTTLGLFFLYRGGEPLAGHIRQFIHDRLGARGEAYFRNAIAAVRATMVGMIVVSLIDGILCGLAYAIAAVPSPAVWGAVTGLLAMIPFLAYVAVAGIALVLFAKGAAAAAMAVFAWGVLVVFVADKFVRTALLGRGMRLGFFWVLVGSLGGLETFGFLGVFIGPIILALVGALLRDTLNEAS